MSDLVGFLLARLAEDEAAARACSPSGKRLTWVEDTTAEYPDDDGTSPVDCIVSTGDVAGVAFAYALEPGSQEAVAAHIARWDPARVLAEVAAKRAIIDFLDWYHPQGGEAARERWRVSGRPMLLWRLAQPYAEHPEFDPAWKMEP